MLQMYHTAISHLKASDTAGTVYHRPLLPAGTCSEGVTAAEFKHAETNHIYLQPRHPLWNFYQHHT